MRAMAESVVKCLPAISSTSRRPFAISFLSPAMVIPPAGKAIFTATSGATGHLLKDFSSDPTDLSSGASKLSKLPKGNLEYFSLQRFNVQAGAMEA